MRVKGKIYRLSSAQYKEGCARWLLHLISELEGEVDKEPHVCHRVTGNYVSHYMYMNSLSHKKMA